MSKPLFGWKDDPKAVDAFLSKAQHPLFAVAASPIRGSGKGKVQLLHKVVTQVLDEYPINTQEIGDCVGHGWGGVCDVLRCVRIHTLGMNESFTAPVSTEAIYGGSRVEIGGGRLRGDGSVGAWAAEAVMKYGLLLRQKYTVGNQTIDLSGYSGERAKLFGQKGIPDALEPIARQNLVKTASLVTSYEDARDAIYNMHPVVVCSNQGFTNTRDSQGFARAQGSWPHCMYFVAMQDTSRAGLLCVNSWGKTWISGPKAHEQPEGSFWVDADVVDRMLRQNDSYAISDLDGFRAKPMYVLG